MFFHGLPVTREEQLVALHTIDSRNPGFNPTSFPNYRDFRDHVKGLSGLAAYTLTPVNLSAHGEPVQGFASVVTGNYFQVLGVVPALGRLIGPDDDRVEGQAPVAVLSNGLWVRQFASDPGIVGRTVRLNGVACDVVGVLPREFTGTDIGLRVDLWLPMSGYQRFIPGIVDAMTERRLLQFSMIGRLADRATAPAVQGELDALSAQLQRDFPDANRDRSVRLMPLRDALVDPNLRPTLLLASQAIGLVVVVVLLIACMNVANLLVGRAASRRTEIAVRVALGAGRGRIALELLTEQVLIGLGGAVVGVALGAAAWRALWAVRPTNTLPVIELPTGMDVRLLTFSVLLAIGTSLVFGLAPMLQVFRSAPIQDLRERGAGHTVRRWGLRVLSLICEVALSIVTLVSAGLFFHSFRNARQIPTGFATERLLIGFVDVGAAGLHERPEPDVLGDAHHTTTSLPGVRGASLATVLPFVNGGFSRTVFLDGDAPPAGGNGQFVTVERRGRHVLRHDGRVAEVGSPLRRIRRRQGTGRGGRQRDDGSAILAESRSDRTPVPLLRRALGAGRRRRRRQQGRVGRRRPSAIPCTSRCGNGPTVRWRSTFAPIAIPPGWPVRSVPPSGHWIRNCPCWRSTRCQITCRRRSGTPAWARSSSGRSRRSRCCWPWWDSTAC